MSLQFYNTLTKQKEDFTPLEGNKARIYNCGPTVYDYAHIGNFRSFCFADALRRYLEYKGYEVTQIMNITDVGHMTTDADEGEDKMELQARKEKKDPWQIADFYAQCFFEDAEKLRLKRASVYPRATEHIEEMIALTQKLLDRGYAYEINGCVYYDVTKFEHYGQLSGNTIEDLNAGARIEVNPDKKGPLDFALWKQEPGHIMQWDSPWGRGFPGWHIECSAMSMKYLGETFDIHTGGEDNIFPHHEDEIAQAEGATGKPFVKYWMHARHLLVDNQKMSKSLGNFYTLRDLFERGYDPLAIRYSLISTHYRQPLNFTLDGIDASKNAIQRLSDFLLRLKSIKNGQDNPAVAEIIQKAQQGFDRGMDDDLNMSMALGSVFELIREVNKIEISEADAQKITATMKRFDSVLGVLEMDGETEDISEEIEGLIQERNGARKAKNFDRADQIRDELEERGIILEDTPQGTRWKKA